MTGDVRRALELVQQRAYCLRSDGSHTSWLEFIKSFDQLKDLLEGETRGRDQEVSGQASSRR